MAEDPGIVIRQPGERWRQPKTSSYDNERGLQDILLESPSLLPGLGEAAIVDEFYIPDAGSVDLVAVEPSGTITLVECKLAANAEVKRAVVGQVLSYASAIWRLSYEEFDHRFQQRSSQSLIDAVARAADHDGEDWDAEDFRATVSANLADGRLRLFIAVDRITDELKRIVEYVNTHTSRELELLALELAFVADQNIEILIPRTHGSESARIRPSAGSSTRTFWAVEDVFAGISELCGPDEVGAVQTLHDDVLARGGKIQPGSGQYPTMSGYVPVEGSLRAIWAVYADPSGPTAPRISINFGSLKKTLSPTALEAILAEFEAIEAIAPNVSRVRAVDFEAYPTIPLRVVATDDAVERLLNALDPHLPPAAER